MIELHRASDLGRLRRHVLAAQGLLQASPFGRGLAGARRAMQHIGYVQIDTISVVERAHHHVLHTRVPGFRPAMTDRLLRERDIFEYWTHAAAYIPIDDFRFSLPYKHAIANGTVHWHKRPDRKLMAKMLARIRSDGPLCSRDIESQPGNGTGWWDWKPAKKALEQLYMEGELMVADRVGFQKTYDLTERVLPAHVNTKMPSIDELAKHLVDQHLRCHAAVLVTGVTYLRRNAALRRAVKALLDGQVDSGELQQARLPSGAVLLFAAGLLDQTTPRASQRLTILSPFDNSVIQRDRLRALFQFDYTIECYLPAAKRRYGYFSLPLLYRDTFVGRLDCKVYRDRRHLVIRQLHWESKDLATEAALAAFAAAVARFCQFQQCDTVALETVVPKSLAARFAAALDAVS